MDLSFSTDQLALRESARGLLTRMVTLPRLLELRAHPPVFDSRLWQSVVNAGWPAVLSSGMGIEEAAIIWWEIGRALAPVPIRSSVLASWLLQRCATPGAAGHAEEIGSGRRTAIVATTSRLDSRNTMGLRLVKGRLSGALEIVRDAAVAEVFICIAQDASKVHVVAVAAGAEGLEVVPRSTSGALGEADLRFEAVVVETLGQFNGDRVLRQLQTVAQILDAAEMGGACERVLEMTKAHATGRIQFDRPIGSFPAVQHRLADMLTDCDGISWMVRRAASDPQDDLRSDKLAVWSSQASRRVLASAHQIHGGVGFIRDHPLPMYFGRQKAYELSGGLERDNLTSIAEAIFK
jgi:alkylation response protein AidB-like acyl-CoA dehydrogenase